MYQQPKREEEESIPEHKDFHGLESLKSSYVTSKAAPSFWFLPFEQDKDKRYWPLFNKESKAAP